MIVDASVLMRNAISIILESDSSFDIVSRACNGQDALDKLNGLKPELQPGIILTDIEMPEMDGLTFLRHARLKTRAKVVVLSSKIDTQNCQVSREAMRLGASAVVSKPSGAISFDLEDKRGQEIIQTLKKIRN